MMTDTIREITDKNIFDLRDLRDRLFIVANRALEDYKKDELKPNVFGFLTKFKELTAKQLSPYNTAGNELIESLKSDEFKQEQIGCFEIEDIEEILSFINDNFNSIEDFCKHSENEVTMINEKEFKEYAEDCFGDYHGMSSKELKSISKYIDFDAWADDLKEGYTSYTLFNENFYNQ